MAITGTIEVVPRTRIGPGLVLTVLAGTFAQSATGKTINISNVDVAMAVANDAAETYVVSNARTDTGLFTIGPANAGTIGLSRSGTLGQNFNLAIWAKG